jgi:hypothetical protein
MTNYEKIMNGMTIEQMAYKNVQLVSFLNNGLYYVTSSGQLFAVSEYERAVQHEYKWLCINDQPDVANVEENTEKTSE